MCFEKVSIRGHFTHIWEKPKWKELNPSNMSNEKWDYFDSSVVKWVSEKHSYTREKSTHSKEASNAFYSCSISCKILFLWIKINDIRSQTENRLRKVTRAKMGLNPNGNSFVSKKKSKSFFQVFSLIYHMAFKPKLWKERWRFSLTSLKTKVFGFRCSAQIIFQCLDVPFWV